MYSRDIVKIIRRAERTGRTRKSIAEELGCTVQSMRNWEAKADIAVHRAISRAALRLRDDLRVAAKAKGGK